MFIYVIYVWWHKDVYLCLCLVKQRCLFMSSMFGGTKMFINGIYVWWHKDVYLCLCLVKQRCLIMSSVCGGTNMFIYVYVW